MAEIAFRVDSARARFEMTAFGASSVHECPSAEGVGGSPLSAGAVRERHKQQQGLGAGSFWGISVDFLLRFLSAQLPTA
jgi:hypothetical protein